MIILLVVASSETKLRLSGKYKKLFIWAHQVIEYTGKTESSRRRSTSSRCESSYWSPSYYFLLQKLGERGSPSRQTQRINYFLSCSWEIYKTDYAHDFTFFLSCSFSWLYLYRDNLLSQDATLFDSTKDEYNIRFDTEQQLDSDNAIA